MKNDAVAQAQDIFERAEQMWKDTLRTFSDYTDGSAPGTQELPTGPQHVAWIEQQMQKAMLLPSVAWVDTLGKLGPKGAVVTGNPWILVRPLVDGWVPEFRQYIRETGMKGA